MAQEDIKKGTVVCQFDLAKKQSFKTEESFRGFLKSLPLEKQRVIVNHAFPHDGVVDVLEDDTEYFNHSNDPNTFIVDSSYSCSALRDIKKGEEITDDYSNYGVVPWFEEIGNELGVLTCTQFVAQLNSGLKQ